MKITKEWLESKNACHSSLTYVCANNYIGLDIVDFLEKLIKEKRLSDANWLITKGMNKKQNVLYAIFAAEQVISIYEKKYPKDSRPRKAIEAAKRYIKNPCKKTKAAAYAAYAAATTDAADAADAAYAADAAANAAYAAAYAADAAYAGYAGDAGDAAANAGYAGDAAYAGYAGDVIRIKILNCGIELIKAF